jgi:uncharacterized protein YdbL (DUF1318 family)
LKEDKIMRTEMRFLAAVLCFIIASCAVITVNIYFPEKAVQEAYKDLEKELMKQDKGTDQNKAQGKPESSIRFEFVGTALAQDSGLAEQITETIKKMPEVVEAYREMGARIIDIDRLRDSGAVGEANSGLLVVREGTLSPGDKKLIDAENQNRSTVMKGMAQAIIKINRVQLNEANLKQVMPQAVEQFAAIRRDSAKKGWWIQSPDGNWSKK